MIRQDFLIGSDLPAATTALAAMKTATVDGSAWRAERRGIHLVSSARLVAIFAIGATLAAASLPLRADNTNGAGPTTPLVAPAPAQSASPLATVDTPLPPAIALPASPAPLPPDVPTTPLTATDAALIALHHQPSITASAGAATAAAGVTEQARSGLLPSIAIDASTTDATIVNGSGAAVTANGAVGSASGITNDGLINLRQLLFDSGYTHSLVNETKAEQLAAGATLTRTQADTVLNVKQAFYTLVQDQRLITVNVANYRSQLAHLALARAQQQAGIGLPADVVQAQTTVSEAALAVNVARNNAEIASVNLALAMGLDARTPIAPADSDEAAPATQDVNAMVSEALQLRPDVVAAAENVKAAQAAISVAKAVNAPAVVATVGVGGKSPDDPLDSSSVTIGAALTWTPYDSGYTAGHIKEAQGELTTAEAQLTLEQQTVTSDVSQAYLNEVLADQRVSQADDEVTNAQESVALAEGRYKAGVGVFLDVIDAQQALLTAQTDRVNAQSALDQGRAALAHAIGNSLPAPPAAPKALPPVAGVTSPPVEH